MLINFRLRYLRPIGLVLLPLALTSCGNRVSASVAPTPGVNPAAAIVPATHRPAGEVVLKGDDETLCPYRSLGDITVTVAKWSLLDPDPSPHEVNKALASKATEMGADEVILVRYGTVGLGLFSYGQMEGRGRAIAYTN